MNRRLPAASVNFSGEERSRFYIFYCLLNKIGDVSPRAWSDIGTLEDFNGENELSPSSNRLINVFFQTSKNLHRNKYSCTKL